MKTLLVERDARQRRELRALLSERGHVVIECARFTEATEVLDRDALQLALLDWSDDASRWVARANDHPNGARLLIVAVLDAEQCGDLAQIFTDGANDFLIRPLARPEYHRRILQFEHRQRGWARILETRSLRGMSHLELAVEHSGDAVEIADAESRYLYVNPGYTRLLGYTFAEAVGRTPAELLRNDYHPPEFYKEISAVIKRGETWRGIVVSRAKNGALVHQDTSVTGILGQDGKLSRIVGVKRDITDRRLAEEAARKTAAQLHAAISSLAEAVIAVDRDRVILLANPAARTYALMDDPVGRTLGEVLRLVDEDSGELLDDPIGALSSKAPNLPATRLTAIDRHGRRLPVLLHINPMRADDGEMLGAALVLRDLTENRRMEDALAARAAAEATSRSKSRFLASMSHELRTPMNGVIGMTTLLGQTALSDEQRDMLATLEQSAEFMVALIDQLLERVREAPQKPGPLLGARTAPGHAHTPPKRVVQPGAQRPPRVLLVDDNVINRQVARRMLGRLSLVCDEAHDGEEAVAAARTHPFDLILMDCHMPGMSGLEATRRIREHERERGLRSTIIAVTANQAYDDRQHCLMAGMDDFLPKPLRFERLVMTLERWNLLPANPL